MNITSTIVWGWINFVPSRRAGFRAAGSRQSIQSIFDIGVFIHFSHHLLGPRLLKDSLDQVHRVEKVRQLVFSDGVLGC